MRKTTRRRPVLESLESMLLLSTVSHADAMPLHDLKTMAHVAPVPGPVVLHGTIQATGRLSGTALVLSGSGNLGKVGVASFRLTTDLVNPTSNVTLSTRQGKIYLVATNGIAIGSKSGQIEYLVNGGTGSHVGATGSGSILVKISQLKGNRVSANLKFV